MNTFLDDFLVGLVLVAGFGYAVYSLGPRVLRARTRAGLSALLGHLPAFFGLRGTARRLSTAATKSKGACGGCDNCGSETPAPRAASEVRIPLARISKRR
jgi:hypothetical protein